MSHSPTVAIKLGDCDIIKLIEEYLAAKHHYISLLSVERETGIINGVFSEDALFLRQLIVDGQWDDALDFVRPLQSVTEFDSKAFSYIITKHKYLELLCLKSEPGPMQHHDFTLEEVVSTLNSLESLAPSKSEYNALCFLLTLPSLSQHEEYKDWNPSSARLQCFHRVFPLIEQFIPPETDRPGPPTASDERLVQLLVKGLLYETCVHYCQQKAVGSADTSADIPHLLGGSLSREADLSLLSWLQSLPQTAFACRFEKKALKLKHIGFERPDLEAAWSEQILATPFKPKKFPYSAVPAKTRSAEVLSRSMVAQSGGLSSSILNSSTTAGHLRNQPKEMLSRSYAGGFRLMKSLAVSTDAMNQSVERLFDRNPFQKVGDNGATPSVRQSNDPAALDRFMNEASEQLSVKSLGGASRTSIGSLASQSLSENLSPIPSSSAETTPRPLSEDLTPCSLGGDITPRPFSGNLAPQLLGNDSTPRPLSGEVMPNSISRDSMQQALTEDMPPASPASTISEKPYMLERPALADNSSRMCVVPPQTSVEPVVISRHPTHAVMPKPQLVEGLPMANSRHGIRSNSDLGRVTKGDYGNVSNSDLFTSYQHHRNRLKEQMAAEEKRREDRWRQLMEMPEAVQLSGAHNGREGLLAGNVSTATVTPVANIAVSRRVGSVANVLPLSGEHHDGDQLSALQGVPVYYPEIQSAQTGFCNPRASVSAPTLDYDMGVKGIPEPETVPKIQYVAVSCVEDQQAIRAAAFSPSGAYLAIGSNSKVLRVCPFPDLCSLGDLAKATSPHKVPTANIVAKKMKHHKGSIYCTSWNTSGTVIATGSNDKVIKVIQFGPTFNGMLGSERELAVHDGTVRDLTFMSENILVSGGAGNHRTAITDCETGQLIRSLSGHSGHILSIHRAGATTFVTGSQDCTARFWDTRASTAISVVHCPPDVHSPFASVCIEGSGCVMASGHDSSHCLLYDIRAARLLQQWQPHTDEVRSVRFSPVGTYLLSGSYDSMVKMADMCGDLQEPFPTVVVAEHSDKVIQVKWHPDVLAFVTTSADRTAKCWCIPV